jgi:serine/threonine protein kinase
MTSNLGTTAWCAPELLTATNKTRYSVKVDVYSYGMVLWELWERKRPYEELYSRFDIIDAVREGRRPAISASCPPTFRSLIQRCWHEQPARRPTFAYIVRYVKDELAHIKRQRMSSAASFSPLHQLLLGSRSKSNGSGSSAGGLSTQQEDVTPSQSVDSEKSHDWLEGGSVASAHSAPVVRHHVQSEVVTSRATISYMPPSHLPHAPLAIPQKPSQESLDMLASSPWTAGEDPEAEEAPSGVPKGYLSAPPGGPVNRAWRDKYVMKFNGWKSSNPDTGLPPSVYGSTGGITVAAAAPASPAQTPRSNSDSPEARSQESSVDSSSEENAQYPHQEVSEPALPRQGAYELDLYSSSSSISPDDLPRLPASRVSDSNSSRASGSATKRESGEER